MIAQITFRSGTQQFVEVSDHEFCDLMKRLRSPSNHPDDHFTTDSVYLDLPNVVGASLYVTPAYAARRADEDNLT
jgi:hypothetical protein